ncbi:MAG TPA: UvrD-helicase domain-containing protein [Candidatus Acidoferrales bacterium]|nr:UvrD-helicase domain-containing protein [Candidatus Acidoferrales bacterium]
MLTSSHSMTLLDDLNPEQREAVLATEGPVLVLAGAGTGKTRVITYRVAHLIEQGTPGGAILAVTFTNKAADQMRERVRVLLARSGRGAGEPWISTFHSFCARLLRREATRLALPHDFAIYDEEDQLAAARLALSELEVSERSEPARALVEYISHAKNHGLTSSQLAAQAEDEPSRRRARIMQAYEEVLRRAGALDFDDLLLRAVEVLRRFGDVCQRWSQGFRFIHVDEYQDTNRVQYDLLHLLARVRQNLCVVGDEDQSIYGWRGADVSNLLRFAEDFPATRVLRLEQNYRSTQKILDAAGGVVAKNTRRLGKTLKARRGQGSNLKFCEARDAPAEAAYVAQEILELQRQDPSFHIAVLYRTNAQSRAFEEALRRQEIRYRVLGGFSFYQRAEIKDALAYVRLVLHPEDDVALLRVLNMPPRGIGPKTVDLLRTRARERDSPLWTALVTLVEEALAGLAPLRSFRDLIEGLRKDIASLSPAEFLGAVLGRSGYLDLLGQRNTPEDAARTENLHELVNAVAEGAERGEALTDFLDRAGLVSDVDSYEERTPVTLLTLHTAKGLEFDHVFLVGLEEGVFPHARALDREEALEEERRLCYVGMTRARDSLTLTRTVYRRLYGNEPVEASLPSRFLLEVPGELVDTAEGSLAEAGATRRYEPDPEYSYSSEEFARRARRPFPLARSVRSPRRIASRPGVSHPLLGQRVRHPTYGLGTITAVDGEGEDRKLTVSFADHGTKKLVERYAHLELV